MNRRTFLTHASGTAAGLAALATLPACLIDVPVATPPPVPVRMHVPRPPSKSHYIMHGNRMAVQSNTVGGWKQWDIYEYRTPDGWRQIA